MGFFLDAVAKFNATYKYVDLTVSSFELGGMSSLASKIENYMEIIEGKHLNYNYKKDVIAFGVNFLDFVNK